MEIYIKVLSAVNLAHWEPFESLIFVLNHKLNSKHGPRSHIPDFSAPLNTPLPRPHPLSGRLYQVTLHLDVAAAVRARARTRQVPTSPRSLLFSRVG